MVIININKPIEPSMWLSTSAVSNAQKQKQPFFVKWDTISTRTTNEHVLIW